MRVGSLRYERQLRNHGAVVALLELLVVQVPVVHVEVLTTSAYYLIGADRRLSESRLVLPSHPPFRDVDVVVRLVIGSHRRLVVARLDGFHLSELRLVQLQVLLFDRHLPEVRPVARVDRQMRLERVVLVVAFAPPTRALHAYAFACIKGQSYQKGA